MPSTGDELRPGKRRRPVEVLGGLDLNAPTNKFFSIDVKKVRSTDAFSVEASSIE